MSQKGSVGHDPHPYSYAGRQTVDTFEPSADGQRFLIPTDADPTPPEEIEVLSTWPLPD